MAKENFDNCLEMLLAHEGGFTSDPLDSGNKGDGHGNQGSTNLGVTSHVWAEFTGKPAPISVMKELQPKDIGVLYRKGYWDRASCDDLPSGLDWAVFDFQVNAGSRSAKRLQRIVNATQDGAIGPATLAEVAKHNTKDLILKFAKERQSYYESLTKHFQRFGRGWTRRNKETTDKAIKMATGD